MSEAPELNEKGECLCGSLQFTIKGPRIFSKLCHCLACSRRASASPVHIVAVHADGFVITQGAELLVVGKGHGRMTHGSCRSCGTPVYQCPEGAPFRAFFPATLRFGGKEVVGNGNSQHVLPERLQPTGHANYESRHTSMNWYDDLPKTKGFREPVKNDGSPLEL